MLVSEKSANEKNKAERTDRVWWGWGGAWPELSQQAAFC